MVERSRDIRLGPSYSFKQLSATGEIGADGSRKGTAGTVRVRRGYHLTLQQFHMAAIVKHIRSLRDGVATLYHHCTRTPSHELFGSGLHLLQAGHLAAHKHLRLRQVGRHHRRQRQDVLAQTLFGLTLQQPVTTRGHHNRVHHQQLEMQGPDCRSHGPDNLGGKKHTSFRGPYTDIRDHGPDLRCHDLWVNTLHGTDTAGILRRNRRNGAHAIHTKGRKGFEIGLNPGPPTRIRASYREGFREHIPFLAASNMRSHFQVTGRCQSPQALGLFHHRLDDSVNLLLSGVAPQPKTNRGAGQGVIHPNGAQDVRRLGGSRRTCRARRKRHNILQTHEERLALHIGKTHIQVAREALFRVAVEIDIIEALPQSVVETLAQTTQAYAFFRPELLRRLTGFAKAHNARDVERARTHPALVPTTIEQGPYTNAPRTRFADIERSHALRAVELMARERHEIHLQLIDITGYLPCALH